VAAYVFRQPSNVALQRRKRRSQYYTNFPGDTSRSAVVAQTLGALLQNASIIAIDAATVGQTLPTMTQVAIGTALLTLSRAL
jgi:hypothetical protein